MSARKRSSAGAGRPASSRRATFIPIAENTPLSGMLTYWVLDTVAAELGDWLRANPDVRVGINAPPEILGRGGMAYVATKSGLAEQAAQIILEVTERGLPDLLGVEAINQAGNWAPGSPWTTSRSPARPTWRCWRGATSLRSNSTSR